MSPLSSVDCDLKFCFSRPSYFPFVERLLSDDIIRKIWNHLTLLEKVLMKENYTIRRALWNNYIEGSNIEHARPLALPIRCFGKKHAIIRMKINVASGLS